MRRSDVIRCDPEFKKFLRRVKLENDLHSEREATRYVLEDLYNFEKIKKKGGGVYAIKFK